ncbi:MAG UNVERIFIED_CONTAM: PQQ-dependent sugar dehydrogenase [Planctomycetaceae bacterium]
MSNGPVKDAVKRNRISRWTISRDASAKAEPDSELVILEWESNGHNGGDLAFGPDGMLYCPTGDGTTDSDPLATGQGLNDLLAVMIRIDVRRATPERPYSIPADNPFTAVSGARPEIWAYGFRNPWRLDIDQQTGQVSGWPEWAGFMGAGLPSAAG